MEGKGMGNVPNLNDSALLTFTSLGHQERAFTQQPAPKPSQFPGPKQIPPEQLPIRDADN